MTNYEQFLSSLKMIESMKSQGILNDSDFEKSEQKLREKYGIKKTSLFRSIHLINNPFRAMYIVAKKEENNGRNQSNEN